MWDFIRRSMMARLLALGAVALVTSGAQFSCSAGDPSLFPPRDVDSGDGPTFSTTLVLKDSAGTATSRFARGELITFELTVRNRTANAVTLQLATPQVSDVFVFRRAAAEPLWSGSEGIAQPAVVTPLEFGPNETKVILRTWNQVLADGSMLGAGNFEARGAVLGVGVLTDYEAEHELASEFRAFRVN